jgi:hypothetical protein
MAVQKNARSRIRRIAVFGLCIRQLFSFPRRNQWRGIPLVMGLPDGLDGRNSALRAAEDESEDATRASTLGAGARLVLALGRRTDVAGRDSPRQTSGRRSTRGGARTAG